MSVDLDEDMEGINVQESLNTSQIDGRVSANDSVKSDDELKQIEENLNMNTT